MRGSQAVVYLAWAGVLAFVVSEASSGHKQPAPSVAVQPVAIVPPYQPPPPVAPAPTYVVKPGDGWYAIASRAGVDVNSLLAANAATIQAPLYPGQVLQLPAEANPAGHPLAAPIVGAPRPFARPTGSAITQGSAHPLPVQDDPFAEPTPSNGTTARAGPCRRRRCRR